MTHWGPGPSKISFCQSLFLANLTDSKLSLLVDSCLQTDSLNLKDTGNKQTGRKVRVHLVSQLKLWPVSAGRHHNRKGWTDSRGSGQGRSRRLRQKVSMNNTVGNAHLQVCTTHRNMHTRTRPQSEQMGGQSKRLWWKPGKREDRLRKTPSKYFPQ